MEQFVFIGEATYYNDDERKEVSKKFVVRAPSFVEAAQRVENWYGNELIAFNLIALEDQLVIICDDCYNRLLKGEYYE